MQIFDRRFCIGSVLYSKLSSICDCYLLNALNWPVGLRCEKYKKLKSMSRKVSVWLFIVWIFTKSMSICHLYGFVKYCGQLWLLRRKGPTFFYQDTWFDRSYHLLLTKKQKHQQCIQYTKLKCKGLHLLYIRGSILYDN